MEEFVSLLHREKGEKRVGIADNGYIRAELI